MRTKKLLALGMAALMVLSSTVIAYAEDVTNSASANGTVSGNGNLEGYVDKDVFTVTLPTISDVDFVLDPQELIGTTNDDAKLDSVSMNTLTGYGKDILFTVSENEYSTKSDDITIVNKSTFAVEVSVTAKLSGLTPVSGNAYKVDVTDAASLSSNTNTAIAMTLTPTPGTSLSGNNTPGAALSANVLTDAAAGITVKNTVAAIADPESAYEVTVSNGNYSYGIKSDVSSVSFNSITYNLAGKVNTNADWKAFNDANASLKVEITYAVAKEDVDSGSSTPTIANNGTIDWDGTQELTLAVNVASITDVGMSVNGIIFDVNGTWNGTDCSSYISIDGAAKTITLDTALYSVMEDSQIIYVAYGTGASDYIQFTIAK